MSVRAFLAFWISSCLSHSAQVTGRGGFQGHAGLKNRGARATGHGTPTRSAWPGARLPLGSERALPVGPGARWGRRAGPSPTREGRRTPGGSVRLEKHTASLRACPATLRRERSPGHHCYPIIMPRTVATMRAPSSPRTRVPGFTGAPAERNPQGRGEGRGRWRVRCGGRRHRPRQVRLFPSA